MTTQKLVEGGLVYIHGHEFTVRNLRIVSAQGAKELPFARFEGHCTDSPRNRGIRGTIYDGGTYGGNEHAGYTWDD